jgi:aerobic-type carbon monoxide dehydrogenase small subunit (CoxS/CutS family)
MQTISLTVNGQRHSIDAWPMQRLLDVLREGLRLTGTKEGCGEGECGACSILLNGHLVNSCLIPAAQANEAVITTIEGLERPGLREAFTAHGGTQCGFCTPGILMAAHALLESTPHPTEPDIRNALAGNLCRCTGYTKIIEAITKAST